VPISTAFNSGTLLIPPPLLYGQALPMLSHFAAIALMSDKSSEGEGLIKPVLWLLGLLLLIGSLWLLKRESQIVFSIPPSMRAKIQTKSLELAIKGYKTEYDKLPNLGLSDEGQFVESSGPILDILMAVDRVKNPREVRFYDPPSASKGGKVGGITAANGQVVVLDLWGNPYRLHFDWNGDGQIANPKDTTSNLPASVVIYSAGPDRNHSTWNDNIHNWEY
jgi:hypothetical protein